MSLLVAVFAGKSREAGSKRQKIEAGTEKEIFQEIASETDDLRLGCGFSLSVLTLSAISDIQTADPGYVGVERGGNPTEQSPP